MHELKLVMKPMRNGDADVNTTYTSKCIQMTMLTP